MSYNLRECKLQNSQFVQYRLEYNSRIDIVEPWYELWPKFIKKSIYTFEDEGYGYLAVSDIVAYFENISLEILRDEILLRYLPNEQKIINLLMHLLHYWTWKSCEGKPVLRGIPQGNDVSSFLGNIYLLPLDEEFIKFSRKNTIRYFRYMDDVKIFTKEEPLARECIFIMNNILRKLHLNIQGSKTLVLRGEEIKNDIDDERLVKVNELLGDFKSKKKLTVQQKACYIKVFKEQYKKIRTRKSAIVRKDLRLFRRLITGFTLLHDPYLVNRSLKEIEKNPDNSLMTNVARYFKYFPKKEYIRNKLINFLMSPLNKFVLQEVQVLDLLRYYRSYPSNLISYVKRVRKSKSKHWCVRVQAILLLNQLELSKQQLKSLLRQYKLEKNIDVKKTLIKPLCQLDDSSLSKYFKEAIFDKEPKIIRIIEMLTKLQFDDKKAFAELASIFNDFNENRLMDEFYKIEMIKFHTNSRVKKVLLKNLKRYKSKIIKSNLIKKTNRVITSLDCPQIMN
jgi:hypothetical protein